MLKGTELSSKNILDDLLRKERAHIRIPSWGGHVCDGKPCEDGAFDNRRAVSKARDDVIDGSRTPYKNAFIWVPNQA